MWPIVAVPEHPHCLASLPYRQPDRCRNRTYGAQPPAQLLLAADLRHKALRALSTRAAAVTWCDIPALQLGLHSSEKPLLREVSRSSRATRSASSAFCAVWLGRLELDPLGRLEVAPP